MGSAYLAMALARLWRFPGVVLSPVAMTAVLALGAVEAMSHNCGLGAFILLPRNPMKRVVSLDWFRRLPSRELAV